MMSSRPHDHVDSMTSGARHVTRSLAARACAYLSRESRLRNRRVTVLSLVLLAFTFGSRRHHREVHQFDGDRLVLVHGDHPRHDLSAAQCLARECAGQHALLALSRQNAGRRVERRRCKRNERRSMMSNISCYTCYCYYFVAN